jgi:murein DD-endopeptidase MepM/ murein hydrolase activator NlpD
MTSGEALAGLALATITAVVVWPRSTAPKLPPPRPGGGGLDPRPTELDSFGIPYGHGAADPLWPLPEDRRSRDERTPSGRYVWARGRVTTDFGDPRPYGDPSPTRHHVGEDLRAPQGAVVVATERGRVTSIDDAWYEGTGALLVAFDSGITANFGEVEPGSALAEGLAVGTVVERGQQIARIGRTEQLHFELYVGSVRRTWQWPWLGEAPAAALDPSQYLELASKTVPA